ncbi:hypothetical protein KFK09_006304 [Dendrobium nobile]|uniref:ATP-dependent RNA helicase n=1 Tax=Dendrobium nobile TaxID=94219 RepID=A0A8T3BT30_DENNO|nr:hypothetical protein KFK09_006304 [Dendrobium nobile]
MAGLATEGSQFDADLYDSKMNELLSADVQDFFTSYDEVYDIFDATSLHENLLRGIYAYGFEKPSAIQQRGIVPFCKGLDVIQQAQSGTGKTATFCSGILQQLDYGLVECQALVLAPIRELARRIEKVMRALGDRKFMLVWEGLALGRISVPFLVTCMLLLVLLAVFLTCYGGSPFTLTTSRFLFWMRLMKCSHVASRIRYTISFSFFLERFKLVSSLPQCHPRLSKSPANS